MQQNKDFIDFIKRYIKSVVTGCGLKDTCHFFPLWWLTVRAAWFKLDRFFCLFVSSFLCDPEIGKWASQQNNKNSWLLNHSLYIVKVDTQTQSHSWRWRWWVGAGVNATLSSPFLRLGGSLLTRCVASACLLTSLWLLLVHYSWGMPAHFTPISMQKTSGLFKCRFKRKAITGDAAAGENV